MREGDILVWELSVEPFEAFKSMEELGSEVGKLRPCLRLSEKHDDYDKLNSTGTIWKRQ